MTREQLIQLLRDKVEHALHKHIRTPKDFKFLSRELYERLQLNLSVSSLKRIWEYVEQNSAPSETSLSILARLVGYADWEDFRQKAEQEETLQSAPVLSKSINVENDLNVGDVLRLQWHPGRVCDIEYLGNKNFRVVHSENTRLKPGNTFICSLLIEGEPLYIDHLTGHQHHPIAYVCGKRDGIFIQKTGKEE